MLIGKGTFVDFLFYFLPVIAIHPGETFSRISLLIATTEKKLIKHL